MALSSVGGLMYYLYHAVPSDLVGQTLYPLNQLKMRNLDLYAAKVAKYKGREFVMEQRIPLLDCLWNDVLHLLPVNPLTIKEALASLGHHYSRSYFQIDPAVLDRQHTVVYLFGQPEVRPHPAADFAWFDPTQMGQLSRLPAKTVAYYQKTFDQGQSPLLYMHIPHVLYRGTLETSSMSVITI